MLMEQIIVRPTIFKFQTCREFADAFEVKSGDLVLTNQYIYETYLKNLELSADTILQEQYGAGEPTDVMVEKITADVMKKGSSRIIAIGGGTVIDIAKILSVTDGESVDRLYELPVLEKKRPLVAVPTTCGTGSEVTNIAVINRTRLGVKMGLAGEHMFADSAVLIPELLTNLPFSVFAASSIDALVHAVESCLSPKATSYTRLFSYKAIEMIIRGFQTIIREGREVMPKLAKDFLIASNYAGLAFGTAGCAAVHALSNPLAASCHAAHGESNYAVFTGVLKNYMEIRQDGEIALLNQYLAELLGCPVPEVYEKLEDLLDKILPKKRLHEYGVTHQDLSKFAESVMATQERLLKNTFVPLDGWRVLKIYEELL